VTDYYRGVLTQGNWRLVSDIKTADGATALYAEQDGPPLWVKIWKADDGSGTMVQLSGAVVARDSARPPRSGDTGSKPAAKPAS
jgi:hypothetical protein